MFIEDTRERYIFARWCYLLGEPFLSDVEYDRLDKEFKSEFPNDEYSNRHWCYDECPKELLEKLNRKDLIKSLTMGYFAESIPSINTVSEYEETFKHLDEPTRVSFKIDGWNTRVSYYNGVAIEYKTRGRAGSSNNINQLISLFPKRIPIMGKVAITGELSIPNKKWEEFKEVTGNLDQRASVSTLIARSMVDFASTLVFNIHIEDEKEKEKWMPDNNSYTLLSKLGLQTPMFRVVNNKKELDMAIAQLSKINGFYSHLTDGLVVENSKMQVAVRLGDWEEKALYSYVTSYEESQGLYGVAMVISIKPITIEGKTYSRVSVVNLATIVENNLQIGLPISFSIRSSANIVLDTEHTYKAQKDWADRYDEYRDMIDNKTN